MTHLKDPCVHDKDHRPLDLSDRFQHLTQVVYLTSGTAIALSVVASVVFNNPGIALTGIGTSGLSFVVLAPSRHRATHTAASLLMSHDGAWQGKIQEFALQAQAQMNALSHNYQTLKGENVHLTQTLNRAHDKLVANKDLIEALKLEISRLQNDRQRLTERLNKVEPALKFAYNKLQEKRHELSIHLEAIEMQILDVWTPLYTGLISVCDRYDPMRPVTDLEYAGKPVMLDDAQKRKWKHYRDSLVHYDADLRQRVKGMSEECETHDEAYGFFLRLLEELTVNYCKLWAGIKDLELETVHDSEKRAIYSEFENFRNDYLNEASIWVEKSTQVEAGFSVIEQSFKNELANLQQRIVDAERLIETLQSPRQFRGETAIDQAGNRIIDHFAKTGVILDAVESVKAPGGFKLRFKVVRNPDSTRLAESEFDKHCDYLGLWGLSQRPLDFDLDTRNFLLSVNLYTTPESHKGRSSSEGKSTIATLTTVATLSISEAIAPRFQELDCFSAAEFEEVVRLRFVPRVRVVAGSTGGKSPLLELIACAIARIQGGQIWLINPIPGSSKDWFHIPGVVPPGSDGIQVAISWLKQAHQEFKTRRNDLPGTANQPFITVVVDEINAIAREFAEIGTVMKDFYQLSDHTRMGFLTAGQGGNVSGVSGGSHTSKKTGNASKLMEEDFQNATQVFTAAAAKTWIEKSLKGSQRDTFLEQLAQLNQLCAELNQAEGKSAYPTDPTVKKVSPDAYRIALVVSPTEVDPFFIQIPPYSHYVGQLEGIEYPKGAIVTAPVENQMALVADPGRRPKSCIYCGCQKIYAKGKYSDGTPKYVCAACKRSQREGVSSLNLKNRRTGESQ
ncbi:hypothetical protein HC928_04375 [bacterium]|nr:hypothetical protein [bacterium]